MKRLDSRLRRNDRKRLYRTFYEAIIIDTMNDSFYHHQTEQTLRNLEAENRRLRNDLREIRQDALRIREIVEFHDRLEKDFFSADSLEELAITLSNCLLLRPDIDFVSISLTRQYLESVLGSQEFVDQLSLPESLRLLVLMDEEDLKKPMGDKSVLLEKTPLGSSEILFPGHHDEIRSHAILPLKRRGRLIGSLNLGSIRSSHYYSTSSGPALLDRLCAKLAIAVDNILSHRRVALQKELLDHEIRRAALLQRDLLPSPSLEVGSLKITAYYQPCRELGGDFYDFHGLGAEKSALLIADVAGHGFSAALVAAMLKFTFQTEVSGNPSPEAIVCRINEKFCRLLKQDDFITLCCAVFDTKALTMDLVVAGHAPPFLFRSKGDPAPQLRPSSGLPIGVDPESVYQGRQVSLNPGDTLFFYTDGVTETLLGKGRSGGLEEYVLRLGRGLSAEEISRRLHSDIEQIKEGPGLDDDVTLLTVAVKEYAWSE